MLLSAGLLNAQIGISEKKVDVDGSENGYHINIPYGDKKIISKYLKDELKSWKGKVVSKDFFFADDCKLKDMGKNTFDVYARVEDVTKGGVNVYVKVDLGGAYLNSKDHPGDFKFIEKKLYTFAVNAAKDIIEEDCSLNATKEKYWFEQYYEAKEELPPCMPEPLQAKITTSYYVDLDHTHNTKM